MVNQQQISHMLKLHYIKKHEENPNSRIYNFRKDYHDCFFVRYMLSFSVATIINCVEHDLKKEEMDQSYVDVSSLTLLFPYIVLLPLNILIMRMLQSNIKKEEIHPYRHMEPLQGTFTDMIILVP